MIMAFPQGVQRGGEGGAIALSCGQASAPALVDGRLPKRKWNRGQSVRLHERTALGRPPEHSRHFALIALSGRSGGLLSGLGAGALAEGGVAQVVMVVGGSFR